MISRKIGIAQTFLYTVITITSISIVVIGYLWITSEFTKFNQESESLRKYFLDSQKLLLKNEVQRVINFIEYKKSQTETRLKQDIKNRTYEAHAVAMNIYEENKIFKTTKTIKKMIRDALRKIRYNNGRGFYFATELNGVEELNAGKPELEGENLIDLQDENGNYIVRDMIKIVKERGEGYYQYRWLKPNIKDKYFPKIDFIKYFKPYNWFIGTGEYLDDVEKDIQKEVLERIESIIFGSNGYIFAGKWDGSILAGPAKGENLSNITEGEEIGLAKKITDLAKGKGGYLTYVLPKLGEYRNAKKLSYVVGIKEWKWYVGAGVFIDEIDNYIAGKRWVLHKDVKKQVSKIILTLIILLVFILVVVELVTKRTKKSIDIFSSFFKKAAIETIKIKEEEVHFSEFSDLAYSANKMIDDIKEAKQELLASAEIVKAIPSGLFIFENSAPGKLMLVEGNPASEILSFRKIENLKGKEFEQIWSLVQVTELKEEFFKVLQNGKIFESENIHFKNKDQKIIYRIKAFPMPGSRVGVAFEDITQQKMTEQMIKNFFSISLDLLCITNDKGIFEYVNPAFEKIFGYDESELISNSFIEFVHPDDKNSTIKVGKQMMDGKPIANFENRYRAKSGDYICLSWNLMPVPESRLIYAVARDITKEKRSLEERAKLETQLHQAQKMESLGTLAGGIAHDFNNLLMGILGNVSLILVETDPDNPNYEKLKNVETYVQNATKLTKQLLGFARGGKYEVKPTNLNDLIENNSRMFGRTRKEILIDTNFCEDLWSVEADRGQIDQVLLNLYVNAWQAMPDGGNLYLQTENVTLDETNAKPYYIKPNRYVLISVTDTGTGMDKETQERIFEPFFTTKGLGRGSGLGLASAYGIIKNHGGFIDVQSKLGEGTTFKIYLPVIDKKVIEKESSFEGIFKGNETVLLVDDEKMILHVGKEILNKLGYTVFVADNGMDAIKIFDENKKEIEVVILDLILPEMGGEEIFNRINKIKPGIKALISSGYSVDDQAKNILNNGAKGFIQKPFKITELSVKLREILEGD